MKKKRTREVEGEGEKPAHRTSMHIYSSCSSISKFGNVYFFSHFCFGSSSLKYITIAIVILIFSIWICIYSDFFFFFFLRETSIYRVCCNYEFVIVIHYFFSYFFFFLKFPIIVWQNDTVPKIGALTQYHWKW